MATFQDQINALVNALPVLEAMGDPNVYVTGMDTEKRKEEARYAETLVKRIIASMEQEKMLETNGVSAIEDNYCPSCECKIEKGQGHYYVPGEGREPCCSLGCWRALCK